MRNIKEQESEEQVLKKIARLERAIFHFTDTLERTIHTKDDELGSSQEDTALEIEGEDGNQATSVANLTHMRAELASLHIQLEKMRVGKKKAA